jgi:hypothetical protein
MPLVRDTDLVRIDLPADGEFAMVKRKLSRGDRVRVQQAIVKDGRVSTSSTFDLAAADVMDAAVFATLDIAVKTLCVSVGDGISPVSMDATPELLRQLDEDSIDAITEKLNDLYPVRTEAERLSLSANGRSTPEAKAALPQI